MYREGVSTLIINKTNQILLVNLTSFEEQFYSIPGGGIEKGEDKIDAVYREIREEFGIDKKQLEIIDKSTTPVQFDFKTGPRIMHGAEYVGQERFFFLLKFIGEDNYIRIDESEVRKYLWADFSELDKYLLFEGQLDSVKKTLKSLLPKVF